MPNSYPKILYPKFYYEINNKKINVKDIYPNFKVPEFPAKKKLPDIELDVIKNFLGCAFISFIFLFFLSFFVVLVFISEAQYNKAGGKYFVFVLSILIAIGWSVIVYKLAMKQNKDEEKDYNARMDYYKIKNEEHKQITKEINSIKFVNTYKSGILSSITKSNKLSLLKEIQILSEKEVKKGVSELFFHDFLKRRSDFLILKSVKYKFYYPDLILIDEKSGILLDIEIDEPYILESKEPIHFGDTDEKRDAFFSENNFIVVRFCEDQIVNSPQRCLDVINDTIKNFINRNDLESFTHNFHSMSLPCWDYEQAFFNAYNDSRDKTISSIFLKRKEYDL